MVEERAVRFLLILKVISAAAILTFHPWNASAATLTYHASAIDSPPSDNYDFYDGSDPNDEWGYEYWFDFPSSSLPFFDPAHGDLTRVVADYTFKLETVGEHAGGWYDVKLAFHDLPYELVRASDSIGGSAYQRELSGQVEFQGADLTSFFPGGPAQDGLHLGVYSVGGWASLWGSGPSGYPDMLADYEVALTYVYAPSAPVLGAEPAPVLSAPVPPAIASMAVVPLLFAALGLYRRRGLRAS